MLSSFISWLLIGLAAGWLGTRVMGPGKAGLLWMLVVGVIGSMLGGLVIDLLGFTAENIVAEIVTATIGAVLFIAILRRVMG